MKNTSIKLIMIVYGNILLALDYALIIWKLNLVDSAESTEKTACVNCVI